MQMPDTDFQGVVAIFGSRKIDKDFAYKILSAEMKADFEYITSGNIDGVARIAIQVAGEKGLKITLYNYESGLGWYMALKDITSKNRKMVEACTSAIVVWDGESKGTKREIEMLNKRGKLYTLYSTNFDVLI